MIYNLLPLYIIYIHTWMDKLKLMGTGCFGIWIKRMAGDFDLSNFITGSLCLRESTAPSIKPVHPCKSPLSHIWNEDPLKLLGMVPFTERKKVPEDTVGTPIQEFYRDVNVFITGGTGFLGKVLVEKLLRSMPHIGQVYILIREKKGKSCEERLKLLLEGKLFLRLKAEVPGYLSKIIALPGNISEPGLGLSDEDRQLILDSVQVVFHCAADVRFLEPLRVSIKSNVVGSKHVMDVAKKMSKLKAYVHVSTVFSQFVHRVVEETVPKMNINYKEILNYVETNTDSHIEENLQSILQGWPNTYTFTKSMCENMIQEEAEGLPICIFRPSIVSSTYKEPFQGWTDNFLGIVGLLLGAELGIMHHIKLDKCNEIDAVPVDYVVNCMIAASWNIGNKRDKYKTYVLNFTLSPQNRGIWKQMMKLEGKIIATWPFENAIWCPSYIFTESHFLDELIYLFVHRVQGKIMDTVAVLMGQKPRLSKIYSLFYDVRNTMYHIANSFLEFRNDNVRELWNSLTNDDQKLFHFDVTDMNVMEYQIMNHLGMRYFLLNQSMDSIPAARRKLKLLKGAHFLLKLVFGLTLLKLAVTVSHIQPFLS